MRDFFALQGRNISAQGEAKRRPGYLIKKTLRPERALIHSLNTFPVLKTFISALAGRSRVGWQTQGGASLRPGLNYSALSGRRIHPKNPPQVTILNF